MLGFDVYVHYFDHCFSRIMRAEMSLIYYPWNKKQEY